MKVVCGDCKGIAYVGGLHTPYQCIFKGIALEQKDVEERVEIECAKFDPAPREMRVRMQEFTEVGITTVFGNGSVQIPAEIRERLLIKDGDKILWIRRGEREYGFRKVGQVYPFKPQFR